MNNLLLITVSLIALLTSGCYQTDKLSVSQKDGIVSFYIDKETLKANGADSYYFVDFGVSKDSCEKDCVMWEIVEKDSSLKVADKILKEPLIYGQHIDYMETRIEAKTINSNKYCAAGTTSLVNNKKIIGGKNFQECYKIGELK